MGWWVGGLVGRWFCWFADGLVGCLLHPFLFHQPTLYHPLPLFISQQQRGGFLHFPQLIISFLPGRCYFRVIYFLYSRKNCTTAIIFASPDHLIAIILRRPHHLIIFENNLCLSWSPDCDYLIPVIWNSIMIFVSIIILASPSIWHLFWISKISLLLWQKGQGRKLISKVLILAHK